MKEHYDRALELIADLIKNSVFPEKELEKEKDVILDEINSRLNVRGIHHVTFQLEPRPLHQIGSQEAEAGSEPATAEEEV